MKDYIVEVRSREQFQRVIDYVGTKTDLNLFDEYDGNVFIYVENGDWEYSDSGYYEDVQEEDFSDVKLYSFEAFAVHELGWGINKSFATHEDEVKSVQDMINSPNHYNQFSREVIDTMKGMSTAEEFKGFLKLNAVKYLSRYQGKNGAEDLDKAIWYIEKLKGELAND